MGAIRRAGQGLMEETWTLHCRPMEGVTGNLSPADGERVNGCTRSKAKPPIQDTLLIKLSNVDFILEYILSNK